MYSDMLTASVDLFVLLMANNIPSDLVYELSTKTMILQAATRKLKKTANEESTSWIKTLEHTLDDSINLLRRLQLEVNET